MVYLTLQKKDDFMKKNITLSNVAFAWTGTLKIIYLKMRQIVSDPGLKTCVSNLIICLSLKRNITQHSHAYTWEYMKMWHELSYFL